MPNKRATFKGGNVKHLNTAREETLALPPLAKAAEPHGDGRG
jgi:hypothetical protein